LDIYLVKVWGNEEIEEIQRDPATLSTYLRQYYTNLNPELINQPEVVDKFVKSQLAELWICYRR
jgi:hypothetical protein